MRGQTAVAGELWGRVEAIEDETGERILRLNRDRYERILAPLENDENFELGYQAARAATVRTSADDRPLSL